MADRGDNDLGIDIEVDAGSIDRLNQAADALDRIGRNWQQTAQGLGADTAARTGNAHPQDRERQAELGGAAGRPAFDALDRMAEYQRNQAAAAERTRDDEDRRRRSQETSSEALNRAAQALEKTSESWQRSAAQGMGGGQDGGEAKKRYDALQLGDVKLGGMDSMARFDQAASAGKRVDAYEQGKREQEAYDAEMRRRGHGPTTAQTIGGFNQNLASGLRGGQVGMALQGTADIVGGVLSKFGKGLETLNDSTLTTAQKMHSLAREIPILGSIIQGIQAITSAYQADALRQNMLTAHHEQIQRSGDLGMNRQAADLRVAQAGREAVATARRGQATAGFAGLGVRDPANPFDTIEQSQFTRQIAIAQERQGIQAELAGATARRKQAQAELAALQKEQETVRTRVSAPQGTEARLERLRAGEDKAAAATGGRNWADFLAPGVSVMMRGTGQGSTMDAMVARPDKPEIDRLAGGAGADRGNLAARAADLAERTKNVQAAISEEVAKQGELTRNSIRQEEEKLSILRQQEGVIRGQTMAFGSMTEARQGLILGYLKQARDRGFESLTRGQRAVVGEAFPAVVQRGIQEMMEKNPQFREAQKIAADLQPGMAAPRQTLAENVNAQRDVQKVISQMTTTVAAESAEGVRDAFKGLTKEIIAIISQATKDLRAEFNANQIRMNNGRGGP